MVIRDCPRQGVGFEFEVHSRATVCRSVLRVLAVSRMARLVVNRDFKTGAEAAHPAAQISRAGPIAAPLPIRSWLIGSWGAVRPNIFRVCP